MAAWGWAKNKDGDVRCITIGDGRAKTKISYWGNGNEKVETEYYENGKIYWKAIFYKNGNKKVKTQYSGKGKKDLVIYYKSNGDEKKRIDYKQKRLKKMERQYLSYCKGSWDVCKESICKPTFSLRRSGETCIFTDSNSLSERHTKFHYDVEGFFGNYNNQANYYLHFKNARKGKLRSPLCNGRYGD